MTPPPSFVPFPKLYRLFRNVTITEKLDGTNAQVWVSDDLATVHAGSRSRWITPGKQTDNYGFAAWVDQNADDLRKLGPGHHFGEWWGQGVQRAYCIVGKRFSLFNTFRWKDDAVRPACCHVVPTLYSGEFSENYVKYCLTQLEEQGSVASPGFMRPEGLVVFHEPSGQSFKVTLGGDGHKGEAEV